MKIEDAIKSLVKRAAWTGYPSVLTLDDLRAVDWQVATATAPAPTPAPTPVPAPAPIPAGKVAMFGPVLSGGESNSSGTRPMYYDYVYPPSAHIQYWLDLGMTAFRIPFLDKRIAQAKDLAELDRCVNLITSKGAWALLDLHGYGKINGQVVGVDEGATEMLANFWALLAGHYAANSHVILGIMNEPKQTPDQWWGAVPTILAAIRAKAPTALVAVPGGNWTGAHAWVSGGNAAHALAIKDPNVVFEVHQYLNKYSTGMDSTVVPGWGATCLKAATDWARANKRKMFFGEGGFGPDPASLKEGGDMVRFIAANPDVWAGATFQGGGTWWPDQYYAKLTPLSAGDEKGLQRPQVTTILSAFR